MSCIYSWSCVKGLWPIGMTYIFIREMNWFMPNVINQGICLPRPSPFLSESLVMVIDLVFMLHLFVQGRKVHVTRPNEDFRCRLLMRNEKTFYEDGSNRLHVGPKFRAWTSLRTWFFLSNVFFKKIIEVWTARQSRSDELGFSGDACRPRSQRVTASPRNQVPRKSQPYYCLNY